jgi:hypothetical protein
MFLRRLIAIIACLLIAGPAHAAKVKPWTFTKDVSWTHPDGRKVTGSMIQTFVDNDKLMIFRDRRSRYYIRFALYDNSVLVDRRTTFFVLDNRDDRKARMVALEIEGRAWPRKAPLAGVAVTQLTKADLRLLRQHSGNLLGVSYFSQKPGERKDGYSRNYKFSGDGFSKALASLTGVQTPSTVSQAPPPKPAAKPQQKSKSESWESIEIKPLSPEEVRRIASMPPPGAQFLDGVYMAPWPKCDRPDISRINSADQARRVHTATKRFQKCAMKNLRKASDRIRRYYSSRGVKVTGLFPKWNRREAMQADQHEKLKKSAKHLMDYNAETVGFIRRSHQMTRKWINHSN